MMMRPILLMLTLVAITLLGVGGYAAYRELEPSTFPSQQTPIIPTPSSSPQDIPAITKEEKIRGWYWGTRNQKKPETPNSWIYQNAGRSSCWHAPNVICAHPLYTCPENGWENCMPILSEEAERQCTKEALQWKRENCQGFQGAAL